MAKRLSVATAEAIREAYRLKPNFRVVAEQLGVSLGQVHKVVHAGMKREEATPANFEEQEGLRTLSDLQIRDRSWDSAGAVLILMEGIELILQKELARPLPEPLIFKGWSGVLKDLTLAYAINVDKSRLLHGEATQITAKAEQLMALAPQGLDNDLIAEVIITKITGKMHPALLPQDAA